MLLEVSTLTFVGRRDCSHILCSKERTNAVIRNLFAMSPVSLLLAGDGRGRCKARLDESHGPSEAVAGRDNGSSDCTHPMTCENRIFYVANLASVS